MVVSLMGAEVMPGRGLGEANRSSFTRDGEYSYAQLDYSCGITFFFSVADGMKLDSFEVNSRSTVQLFGEPLFPRVQKEILALLRRRLSASDQQTIQVTRNEDVEEILLKVSALGAEFYFDFDENLQAVHWGVLFNDKDEIAWPR